VNHSKLLSSLPWLAACALLATACGPTDKPMREPAPAPEPPAEPPAAAEPAVPELPTVPEGASVRFGTPEDGAEITAPLGADGTVPVPVTMIAVGIKVEPAGTVAAKSGHHHILIDTVGMAAGTVVPADAQHLHFGKAQTATTLKLKPGEHTLSLQFADGVHRAYGPALSASIKVQVMANGVATAEEAPPAAEPQPAHAHGAEGHTH